MFFIAFNCLLSVNKTFNQKNISVAFISDGYNEMVNLCSCYFDVLFHISVLYLISINLFKLLFILMFDFCGILKTITGQKQTLIT